MITFTVKVKSTTVQGSRNHPRENVKANVVIGNIPVANGIVHLIDKPLIIVASPLWDYLQEEVSSLNDFHLLFLTASYWVTKSLKSERANLRALFLGLRFVGIPQAYSCVTNKRACTPYLILVQLPPCAILFGPAHLLIFGHFSGLYENEILNFLSRLQPI